MKLGDYLFAKRVELGLNQTKMAEKIGTSQCYYSQLETNKIKPGFKLISKLCTTFNLSVEELREMYEVHK